MHRTDILRSDDTFFLDEYMPSTLTANFIMQLENDLEKLEKQMQENSKARANLEQELQESQRGKEDSVSVLH